MHAKFGGLVLTNIEIRIRGVYSGLSTVEKKVADYFLDNVNKVFSMPIASLAQESGVSQVAWVRFCKTIGFEGLKDLKRSLFGELNETIIDSTADPEPLFTDIKNLTSVDQMAQTVKISSVQAIEDTVKLLDRKTIEKAAQLIIKAESVKIFGVGASALVAEDLFNKLLRIGKNVCFCRDNHIQLTYAANLTSNDVAIFFSNSGSTSEIMELLDIAKKRKCPSVAVTRFCKSPLAFEADMLLYTSSPEVYRRSGAMSSRIAQLIAVDILFTAIASQDYYRVEHLLENSFESCHKHKVN